MADWNHSFDYFAFTPEEKEQLTDRLRQAAEQEERMKEPTKRIIRHTGRRLLIGAGAAAAARVLPFCAVRERGAERLGIRL